MSLRESLQEMVEHTPEGVDMVSVRIDWLRRQLDGEVAQRPSDGEEAGEVYLTTSEAAQRLSMQPETIARWCRQDRFPNAFKTSSDAYGEWRIPLGDVMRLAGNDEPSMRDRIHFDRN